MTATDHRDACKAGPLHLKDDGQGGLAVTVCGHFACCVKAALDGIPVCPGIMLQLLFLSLSTQSPVTPPKPTDLSGVLSTCSS